jgi:hypothetical protein
MDEKTPGKVACIKCRFYQITWEPRNPYACTAHGFKSHRNPALVVFESSGIECQLFAPKEHPREAKAQRHKNEI